MSTDPTTYRKKFQQTIDHVSKDVSSLRTGKASIQMLDDVLVEAYGSKMKINEVGNVSILDANMLVVTPWDKGLLKDIEKAITVAQLNLNPIVDGEIVRVPVPSLTQERRQEMVKLLSQKTESGKVMLRTVRVDIKKDIESQKGESGISEDDIKNQIEELEKITKEFIAKIDEMAGQKEADLMSI